MDLTVTDWAALLLIVVLAIVLVYFLTRRRWPEGVTPEEQDVDVDTVGGPARIHYLKAGAPRKGRPPIALIHGQGGSLHHYSTTIMPALAREYQVIALDRPGYGHSTRPDEGAGHLKDQAAVLKQAIEAAGIERPVLVGHSFGGAVALAYAVEYPEAVAGLALLAPAIYPFRMKPPLSDRTIDSPMMRRALAWTIGPLVAKRNAEAFTAAAFAPQDPPSDYASAAGGDLSHRPSQLEAMMEDGSFLRDDLAAQTPRYDGLKLPISVLFGDSDQILTFEDHGPRLAAVAPQTRLQNLPGIGHMLPFSAPEETLATIRGVAEAANPRALARA